MYYNDIQHSRQNVNRPRFEFKLVNCIKKVALRKSVIHIRYVRVSPCRLLIAYWALTLALLTAEASMAELDRAGGVCLGEPLL